LEETPGQIIAQAYYDAGDRLDKMMFQDRKDLVEKTHKIHERNLEIQSFTADFVAAEPYGPMTDVITLNMELEIEDMRDRVNDIIRERERYHITQRIKMHQRFDNLRSAELRPLNDQEAFWIRSDIVCSGSERDIDRFVTNMHKDLMRIPNGRRFDVEFEYYDPISIYDFLQYGQSKKVRKRSRRWIRRDMRACRDLRIFAHAEDWNRDWLNDDVLECMHLLYALSTPLPLPFMWPIDEIPVRIASFLNVQAGDEDEVSEHQAPSYPSDESWVPVDEVVLGNGRGLYEAFSSVIETLSADNRTFVVRTLDVVAALYNLSQAQTKVGFMSLLYSAVRTIFRDVTMDRVKRFSNALIGRLEVQAGGAEVWRSIANALSSMWEGAGTWIACPMVDVVLDVINLMAFAGIMPQSSIEILDDPKYKIFARTVKREVCGIPDMLGVVIRACMMAAEVVATYCENGIIDFYGWACGSRKEIFSDHAALMSERSEAAMGLLSSPRRGDQVRFRSPQAYSDVLDKTIDGCTNQMRKCKNLNEKNIYARMMKELMTVRNDITMALRCAEARVKPFTYSVYGATSSMKSTVAHGAWKCIAKENGFSTDATNYCTVNFKDEYFSEVHQQEILVMDDFMNEKDTSAQKVNPVRILLDWSSNNAVQLPGAAIHEKGKKFCMAKVLGLTCHDREFHAHTMSYQPEAAYRRVEVYIEVVLGQEYKDSGGRPDNSKINARSGPDACFPDIWKFNCWTCHIDGTGWSWKRIGNELMDNADLEDLLREMSKKHFYVQEQIVSKLTNSAGWFCEHDRLTGACRVCRQKNVTVQSEEVEADMVDMATILQAMKFAVGGAADNLTSILLADMLSYKDMGELRHRINRCAGECLVPIVDAEGPTGRFTVNSANFIAMFRDDRPFEIGPEQAEIPLDSFNLEEPSVQAQCFEMHDGLFYETITWDELEELYPDISREQVVIAHEAFLDRMYNTDDMFTTVTSRAFSYEVVYTIIRTPYATQADPPLPNLEPAGTYTATNIKKNVVECIDVGYGPEGTGRHPFTRYRKAVAR
jgi:hypothetical protein